MKQWEVWKGRPAGFEKDHWFVIISNNERIEARNQINGLACFSLRGKPLAIDVRLNGADGFAPPTVCQCDLLYLLEKTKLHSPLGPVSWERQQQIKQRLREVLRI